MLLFCQIKKSVVLRNSVDGMLSLVDDEDDDDGDDDRQCFDISTNAFTSKDRCQIQWSNIEERNYLRHHRQESFL